MKIVRASVFAAGVVVGTACGADSEEWTPEVRALAGKAQEHFEAGRLKDAEATYLEALKIARTNLHLLSNLGVVQFQAKKDKLAEETLKKALEVASGDEFVRCTLGMVYRSQGKLDAAIDELTKALAIHPKSATAHRHMSIVASEAGSGEAARKHAEMAATLEAAERDSAARAPSVRTAPLGDFLTPLEKSRLKIPPGTYRPVKPPAGAKVRQ